MPINAAEQGGFDFVCGIVEAAAVQNFALCQKIFQTAIMTRADDFRIIAVLQRAAAIKSGKLPPDFSQEFFLDALLYQQVIGCHAGLPRIDALAPGDAFGRLNQIGALIYDAGAFAAEFQRNRGEVFGGGFHHDFAYGHAAGEENIVEFLRQ